MILWTIQNKLAYESMKETGVLRVDENYILDDLFYSGSVVKTKI